MTVRFDSNDPLHSTQKPIIQEKKAPTWRSRTVWQQQQQQSKEKDIFLNNPKPPPTPFPKPIAMVPGRGGISGMGSDTRIAPPRPQRPPRSNTIVETSKTPEPFIENRPRFFTDGALGPPPDIPLPKRPDEEKVRSFTHKAFSLVQQAKQSRIRQAISSVFNLVRGKEEKGNVKPRERMSVEELGGLLTKSLFLEDGSLDPEVNLRQGQPPFETYLEQSAQHVDLYGKTNTLKIAEDLDQAFAESFSQVKETEFRKLAFQVDKEVTVDGEKGPVKEFAAPNLTAFTELFNKTSTHFHNRIIQAGIREINAGSSPEKVKEAYQKEFQNTLDIAYKLYKKGNYQAALAVYSSFQGGEFSSVRDNNKDHRLKTLNDFFSGESNYKAYRKQESSAKVPLVIILCGDLDKMFETNVPGDEIAKSIEKRVSSLQDRLEAPKQQKTDFVKQIYSENIDENSLYPAYANSGLRAIMKGAS